MGRVYFYFAGETSFDQDDIHHHPCKGEKKALVVKPRVTTIVGVEAKQPLVHALDAIVPSSANNA